MTNKKYTKIFLDMDGCITDFEKKYTELFDESPKKSRSRKEFNVNWEKFIKGKNFEKLDWFPGGRDLIKYLESTKLPIEILSSAGGEKFYGEVSVQKIRWLRNHGINFKANIVSSRKLKKEYASNNTILIDDTEDVVIQFNEFGGNGILHQNSSKTIKILKKMLE